MARGKKKESALTPEEKLAQALVPVEEQPYKVPENWCWTKQGSVSKFLNGRAYKQTELLEDDTLTPVLRVGNLFTNGSWYYSDLSLGENKYIESSDLIYAWSASFGPFIWQGGRVIYHYHIWKVELSEVLYKQFYYYWLMNDTERLKGGGHGTGMIHVTKEMMEQSIVPVPPLAEQQRIVNRIESLFAKLDEAKEKAQSVLDSFETRKAAILHKAFTGELTAKWRAEHGDQIGNVDVTPLDKVYDDYNVPHYLPSTWRWVRFNDCCTFVGSGVTPKGGKEVYQTTGVPFIRSQNVLKGTLDLSDVAYIPSETDAAMKRTRIFGGETLFNITGASIGRACFVPFSQTIGNVNQHVCILRYKNYVVPELPQFWLNSPAVQDFVVGNQIGQTRQALNFKQIRGMYYPLAPIAEQSEIVRILDSLFAKEQQAKEAAEAVLEKIDLLKKSILAHAFRGELGTNDAGEESALELLKTLL